MTHVSHMIFETLKSPRVKLAVSDSRMPFISDEKLVNVYHQSKFLKNLN